MPQMSPYNWLILMMLFNLTLILTIKLIYYMPLYSPKINLSMYKLNYNWKW